MVSGSRARGRRRPRRRRSVTIDRWRASASASVPLGGAPVDSEVGDGAVPTLAAPGGGGGADTQTNHAFGGAGSRPACT